MDTPAIQQVVIVGRGYTPILTAVFLQKKWRAAPLGITIIQAGEYIDPPALSCVSSLRALHTELGLAEKDFVRKTGASFHLGTLYQFHNQFHNQFHSQFPNQLHNRIDSDPALPDFFLCEAPYGFNLKSIHFHHWFHGLVATEANARFDDFCLNALLAKAGRFSPASSRSNSVFAQVCHGYKFLTTEYARYLAGHLAPDTRVKDSRALEVQLTAEGKIKGAFLDNGEWIAGDLFIDCSGERLLKKAIPQVSGKSAGPNPPSWQEEEAAGDSLGPPSTSLTLGEGLLRIVIPLRGKVYRQDVSCESQSQWMRDAAPWQANCIALGAALWARPPLLIDSTHLLASALYRLHRLWPPTADLRVAAGFYNESTAEEAACIADSDSLHAWAAAGRRDEYLTEAAQHKLRLFASDGRLPRYDGETLTDDQWAALFFACGVVPRCSDPLIQNKDRTWAVNELKLMRQTLREAADRAPLHADFYRQQVLAPGA